MFSVVQMEMSRYTDTSFDMKTFALEQDKSYGFLGWLVAGDRCAAGEAIISPSF